MHNRMSLFKTNVVVVFGVLGDLILLGVRTLEGFGIMVDDVAAAVYAGAILLIGLKIYPELAHGT